MSCNLPFTNSAAWTTSQKSRLGNCPRLITSFVQQHQSCSPQDCTETCVRAKQGMGWRLQGSSQEMEEEQGQLLWMLEQLTQLLSPILLTPCQLNCCHLDSISSNAPSATISFSCCFLALYQLLHTCIHPLTQCSHPHCCLLTSFFPRLPTYLIPAPFHIQCIYGKTQLLIQCSLQTWSQHMYVCPL